VNLTHPGWTMKDRQLLITGRPGTGKTTLLARLAERFRECQPAGFLTEEIRRQGVRQGFRLNSLDGREGVLAHVDFQGPERVGRYGVDVAGFEAFLEQLDLPGAPTPLIFIDEIGKMECLSPHFVALMRGLLTSGRGLVATVALQGSGFIAEAKRLVGAPVEVRPDNRERLVKELEGRIAGWLKAIAPP
jgi:nucleoside-triphosphatase